MLTSNLHEDTKTRDYSSSLDPGAVVFTLWARRRFILLGTALSGLIMLALSFLLHNTYKATTIVLPPERSGNSVAMLGGAAGAAGLPTSALAAFSLKSPSDLYVALMSAPGVEDSVVKRFKLQQVYGVKHASEARKELENHMQITADPKSGLITISVVDKDPDLAAQIANGIVTAFDNSSSHLAITDAQRRRLFFERQVEETKDSLSHSEENLKNSQKTTGLIEPEADARALIAYEAQLRSQIAAKAVEMDSMKVYLADENPQVQTAQRELDGLRRQAELLSRRDNQDSEFSTKSSQTNASVDYLRKLRDVKYNETLLELLMKNLEVAKLDEAREGSIVQVVDSASPPDTKSGPHRSLFLAGGIFVGLLLSTARVVARSIFPESEDSHA